MQCAVAGAACASRRGCLPCSVSCSSWACWRCPPSLPLLTVCLPSRRMASRLSRTRLFRHSRARNSPESFAEQFGYAQSYFGKALSSLTDTYSHIYGAEDGEVDFSDAIMQRRILVVLLPSLEKAPAELASLGKISLSAIRNACAVGLGANIEGDAADVLEALPTDAIGIGPYLCIVDEYAAIVTPGFEVVLTQGRGLGIAAIVASQDYAAGAAA